MRKKTKIGTPERHKEQVWSSIFCLGVFASFVIGIHRPLHECLGWLFLGLLFTCLMEQTESRWG